jgi:hypothetical protein
MNRWQRMAPPHIYFIGMAGTSRSRIDQQSKGPFNGFEDRAYHRARLAPTGILSTLPVEDEEEHGQGQTGEGVDECREQSIGWNESSRHIEHGEDQIVDQQERGQDGSDQREECRGLEVHNRLL